MRLFFAGMYVMVFVGCAGNFSPADTGHGSWVYWLQNISIEQLENSSSAVVVIDYSADGSEQNAFSRADITRLRESGKTVLCYLSIGEAEDYRWYWDSSWDTSPPAFIGPENPDWPGNYKVEYWQEQWYNYYLLPYIDTILEAGYDGLYLDIVDAYYYWGVRRNDLGFYADSMIDLVSSISDYCRARSGSDFLIIPQNALGIYTDAALGKALSYQQTVSGAGVESIFFNSDEAVSEYRLDLLREWVSGNKLILNVEYISENDINLYLNRYYNAGVYMHLYRGAPDAALSELQNPVPGTGE